MPFDMLAIGLFKLADLVKKGVRKAGMPFDMLAICLFKGLAK